MKQKQSLDKRINKVFKFSIALLLTISAIIIYSFSLNLDKGKGLSMYPTSPEKSVFLRIKPNVYFQDYNHNDIVSVSSVGEDKKTIYKRIIALPNETIAIKNEVIYLNGEVLREKFLNDTVHALTYSLYGEYNGDNLFLELGNDEYFYLGDNRAVSADSRQYGITHHKNILSKNIELYLEY